MSIQLSGFLTGLGHIGGIRLVCLSIGLRDLCGGDCGVVAHVILIDENKQLWRMVQLVHQEV